jgi:hypothetical protein
MYASEQTSLPQDINVSDMNLLRSIKTFFSPAGKIMNSSDTYMSFYKRNTSLLALMVLGASLVACAAVPPAPVDAIQAAESAIKQAEEARVADYASAELGLAKTKLAESKALAEKSGKEKDAKSMQHARDLAEEARTDADLAKSKAQAAHAEAVSGEMQRDVETLQMELQRKQAPQQKL